MRAITYIALCALPLFLLACEYTKNVTESLGIPTNLPRTNTSEDLLDDGCPKIKVVQELASMIKFPDGVSPSEQSMHSRMDITNVTRTCQFDSKTMTVDVTLDFKAIAGQSGQAGSGRYPFFVAVTTPRGQIIAKEVFEIPMEFPADGTPVLHQEKLRHVIPISSEANGADHVIMAGMQLTPSQLSFNRNLIREQIAAKKAAQKATAKTQSMPTASQGNDPLPLTTQHNAGALETTDMAPPPGPVQIQQLDDPQQTPSVPSSENLIGTAHQPTSTHYNHEHF